MTGTSPDGLAQAIIVSGSANVTNKNKHPPPPPTHPIKFDQLFNLLWSLDSSNIIILPVIHENEILS
jgi:hypothetical protein